MKNLLLFTSFIILSSCSRIVTPVDTSGVHYIAGKFTHKDIQAGGLAILPIKMELPNALSVKQAGEDALLKSIQKQFPGTAIVSPSESGSRINDADLSGEYAHLIDDYKISGILKKSTLVKLQQLLGVNYLLYTEVSRNTYPNMSLTKNGRYYIPGPSVSEYVYKSELWDARHSLTAWQGTGGEARSLRDSVVDDQKLMTLAADNLAKRVTQDSINVSTVNKGALLARDIQNNNIAAGVSGIVALASLALILVLVTFHH